MTHPLTIWYITDNKPGHLNQLKGLSECLNRRSEQYDLKLEERWFSYTDSALNWFSLLRQKPQINTPALLIGAGHKTHLKLITLACKTGAYSVVLMRPTLPLRLFNAAIIPAHDNPPDRTNILPTRGVLNRVQPKQPIPHPNQTSPGLMLIGGKSKHFVWNSHAIIEQIIRILEQDPEQQWMLTNSRRTPADFTKQLKSAAPANLSIIDCNQTDADWLPAQLKRSSQVWVTPDSVSMVYEAITAGQPTGLFDLKKLNNSQQNRIHSGIQALIDDQMVTEFKQWRSSNVLKPPAQPLWESDRAAIWLLERFQRELKH
ncbi:MAG: ELM1/GtrOC1 family putative glycosyltransferase [Pseudomonadales bacterium]|nr:ELM1/GtrOC1 family putative glycosyltransferase [Pseudomonadales bacterium]